MSRFTVELYPNLSPIASRLIRAHVPHSMESPESESQTYQFAIKPCIEALIDESEDLYKDDIALLYNLDEYHNVAYIEM